jgi:hypothetical protein
MIMDLFAPFRSLPRIPSVVRCQFLVRTSNGSNDEGLCGFPDFVAIVISHEFVSQPANKFEKFMNEDAFVDLSLFILKLKVISIAFFRLLFHTHPSHFSSDEGCRSISVAHGSPNTRPRV